MNGTINAAPLPLSDLLLADQQTFMDPRQSAVNYAHSWSFVHYLASVKGGQRILIDYFHALRAGKDLDDAFTHVFGRLNLDRLEHEWRVYVGKLR